ncbi:hypothetical protein TNCT_199661 [Trichonephila clavata]|uniref:Uncharacterized protein n=1 Tax=Trichonephila clavata TaxID=2740835 RepID=A0A8X6HQN0_TRICU|nr:hypothetical protein TNCT_199661 [Trichonephila clavata]
MERNNYLSNKAQVLWGALKESYHPRAGGRKSASSRLVFPDNFPHPCGLQRDPSPQYSSQTVTPTDETKGTVCILKICLLL